MNWFHFILLVAGPLVILTDYMTFLSPFLDVIRMSMSFLAHLDSGILSLLNAFPVQPCKKRNPIKKNGSS